MSFKWYATIIGYFVTHSFRGALIGFVIAYVLELLFKHAKQSGNVNAQTPYERKTTQRPQSRSSEKDEFHKALMVLAAHVIQADGKIMHSEMEMMRNFLRQNFGEAMMRKDEQELLELFKIRKESTQQAWRSHLFTTCKKLAYNMREEHREQLLAFLCEIAKADKRVDESEIKALEEIAIALGLSPNTIRQLLSLESDTLADAYAVLGISPDATDEEVRKAYKKMALKYHPDRVATLGEDVKASATQMFQKIGAAKERIYKARGL